MNNKRPTTTAYEILRPVASLLGLIRQVYSRKAAVENKIYKKSFFNVLAKYSLACLFLVIVICMVYYSIGV